MHGTFFFHTDKKNKVQLPMLKVSDTSFYIINSRTTIYPQPVGKLVFINYHYNIYN